MSRIRVEFGMPFKNQTVPHDWVWGEIGNFNPNVDYPKLAKLIARRLPIDGPSNVWIKVGDRLLAAWSRPLEKFA